MAGNLIKERVELTRALGRETAQTLLEGEVIVPDVKPDMSVMLKADGSVFIEKAEAAAGRVRYSGNLTVRVLYLAKGGERAVHSLSLTAPIDDFLNMENVTPDAYVSVTAELANIEYRLVNDRKVGYRAVVEVTAAAECKAAADVVVGIEGLPENQMKRSALRVSRTVERREERFPVKEEFRLAGGKPGAREMLEATAVITNKDCKALDGRVAVSGEVLLTALYKTDDGMVEFLEREIPFNGQIDAPASKEGMIADARLDVAAQYLAPGPDENGEYRVFDAEAIVCASVRVVSVEDVSVLEDAYCLDAALRAQKERITYPRLICRNKNQYPVKEVAAVDGVSPQMMQIFRVSGKPVIDEVRCLDDKVALEGVIHADVLYIAGDDQTPLYCHKAVVPYKQTVETKGAQPGMEVSVEASVEHTAFNMLSGSEVELRFLVNFNTRVTEPAEGEVINDIVFEELDKAALDKLPGMVIYAVKQGETLWDIAKRFNAGAEDIARLNELDEGVKLACGQKLVVVKRVA